jgi:glycerol uptake facilitator protein
MTGSWEARYAAEFFGTLILVLLGNGAVANAFLKSTTGNDDPGLANGGYAASNDVRVNLWKPLEPCDYDWSSNGWSLPLVTRCAVLGTFATSDTAHSQLNGFITEMVGTAVLIFGAMGLYRGMFFHQNIDIANIGVGLLIAAMVISLGGPTGPALNPARDLGPRLVHALLPVPNKGSSHWEYSWVPVVAPIVGAVIGIWLYKIFFSL